MRAWVPGSGCRVEDFGFRLWGLGWVEDLQLI